MATQKIKLGKWIIPSCKIYMAEEEALKGGLKGGGKKSQEKKSEPHSIS